MAKKKKPVKVKPKKDKGFELFYGNLSNRRRFIRNLWTTAAGIIVLSFAWGYSSIDRTILAACMTVFVVSDGWQLWRSYTDWQNEKEQGK